MTNHRKRKPDSKTKSGPFPTKIYRSKKSKWIAVLACATITIAIVAGWFWFSYQKRANLSATLALKEEPLPPIILVDRTIDSSSDIEQLPELNPSNDGWDTEVFNTKASAKLKVLAQLLNRQTNLEEAAIAKIATSNFSCATLRPNELNVAFQDSMMTVFRWAEGSGHGPRKQNPSSAQAPHSYQGLPGFIEAIKELIKPVLRNPKGMDPEKPSASLRAEFKIVYLTPQLPTIDTTVYYHAFERTDAGVRQQNAVWNCRWHWPVASDDPLLESIELDDYEEVLRPSSGQTLFEDCTYAVLGSNDAYGQQLLPGLDHWRSRLDAQLGLRVTGNEGLAVGDVNNDGLDDLFVCQPGGLPNRLFVQNPDGTAKDVSATAGVNFLDLTNSALLLDINRDGQQDLIVATNDDLFFMLNDGKVHFSTAAAVHAPRAHSISAADYDNDGDLDIYVCCYSAPDTINSAPVPYHDANNGPPNYLLRNDGKGKFTDVTVASGMDVNNRRFSFAASWEDYDNDGDQDLYVANDFGRDNLYRNDGGFFRDVAAEAGVDDISAGMSVSWADYNHDGFMDLYVGNMFSSAGSRITHQKQFKEGTDSTTLAHYQRHARGNTLFENAGNGTFRDVSVNAGVTMGRWAWSSPFIDFNNDGWEDLFVANGFITNDDKDDL
ncbi:MAG: VCBS repeat-containing protein [Planctomycetota bacterium]